MLLPAQIGMCILAVCILAEYIEQDLEGSKPEAASKWGSTAYGMGHVLMNL